MIIFYIHKSAIKKPIQVSMLRLKEVDIMMTKVIINDNERGLLFKNGKFVRFLDPGKYREFGDKEIEVRRVESPVYSDKCSINDLMADPTFNERLTVVEVGDEKIAVQYVNGRFSSVLPRGKYAFWNTADVLEFKFIDISSPYIDESVPESLVARMPTNLYTKIEVACHQKALLFFNGRFEKLLDAGTHYFWKNSIKVTHNLIDTRLQQLDLVGQEILTRDKVSLRINFVCSYRVTDYVKVFTEISDYQNQIYIAAQLALREYVGKYRFDEILENKEAMSEFIYGRLKTKEKEFFVEITEADVKDITIPGEIRSIMNTVLIAEKRAQANVITRREEVASTRSLLNTAKLMDENATLYKLKELEYIERICEKVGNINITGSGDVMTQLASILKGAQQ